jgi:glutamine amidotransferase
MIAIIDYGAGNLFSVQNACRFLGLETYIARKPEDLKHSKGIILPGVGAFPDAMKRITQSGFACALIKEAEAKPILGICLGMQMLFQYSTEFEKTKGLCFLDGFVEKLDP